MLNPVDLVRILILLKIDIAAIMGYTGALFKDFFQSGGGILLCVITLFLWFTIPSWIALKKFKRKNL
jgi:Cu-processing system permease protein